jgi:hypothetical protein
MTEQQITARRSRNRLLWVVLVPCLLTFIG